MMGRLEKLSIFSIKRGKIFIPDPIWKIFFSNSFHLWVLLLLPDNLIHRSSSFPVPYYGAGCRRGRTSSAGGPHTTTADGAAFGYWCPTSDVATTLCRVVLHRTRWSCMPPPVGPSFLPLLLMVRGMVSGGSYLHEDLLHTLTSHQPSTVWASKVWPWCSTNVSATS
jgi:hypothetical protein